MQLGYVHVVMIWLFVKADIPRVQLKFILNHVYSYKITVLRLCIIIMYTHDINPPNKKGRFNIAFLNG